MTQNLRDHVALPEAQVQLTAPTPGSSQLSITPAALWGDRKHAAYHYKQIYTKEKDLQRVNSFDNFDPSLSSEEGKFCTKLSQGIQFVP